MLGEELHRCEQTPDLHRNIWMYSFIHFQMPNVFWLPFLTNLGNWAHLACIIIPKSHVRMVAVSSEPTLCKLGVVFPNTWTPFISTEFQLPFILITPFCDSVWLALRLGAQNTVWWANFIPFLLPHLSDLSHCAQQHRSQSRPQQFLGILMPC